ncbi:12169_t:CDS:2 [Gigaspora rosea]|nr:12169_t:CDS:2 [Gigaspora rosea]
MPHNIGGSQDANGLHQRTSNAAMHSLRPQNASGPLQRAPNNENVENPVPQNIKFSNILVSGVSFP